MAVTRPKPKAALRPGGQAGPNNNNTNPAGRTAPRWARGQNPAAGWAVAHGAE
jgi:hypothetical protein